MKSWRLVFTPQAAKDAKKLKRSGLKPKAETLLDILRRDPFQSPPPFEKLAGDLAGAYSRRVLAFFASLMAHPPRRTPGVFVCRF